MHSSGHLLEIEQRQDEVLRELDELDARLEQTLTICQRNLKLVAAPAVSLSSTGAVVESL